MLLDDKQLKKLDLTEEQKQSYELWARYKLYEKRPDIWAADKGLKLTPYQKLILVACANTGLDIRRVSSRAPRGAGKTFLSAVLVLWFADVNETLGIDWECLTTAPRFYQLKKYLWPEIHRVHRMIGTLTNLTLSTMTLKGARGSADATTVGTNKEATIEGLHAPRVLVIVEEAKAVADGVVDSLEGSFSQAGIDGNYAIAYMPSTPGSKRGKFYEIHSGMNPVWKAFHVTIDEVIAAGRIPESYKAERALEWGEDSVLYINHVLAEFANDQDNVFVLSSMLNRSHQRWQTLMGDPETRHRIETGPLIIGLDPAEKGKDEAVAAFYNPEYDIVWRIETEGYTENPVAWGLKYAKLYPHADLHVDAIGYGNGAWGAADLINRVGRSLMFKSTNKSEWRTKERFRARDSRAQASLMLKQQIQAETPTALPKDLLLWEEIQALRPQYLQNNVIGMEPKSNIGELLNRSPDRLDAVSMSIWKPSTTEPTAVSYASRIPKQWNHGIL